MPFSNDKVIRKKTHRRRLLQSLGAGGLMMLAGCEGTGGDSGENSPSTPTESFPESTGKTLETSTFTDTQTANFNPYDPIRHGTHAPWIFFGMGPLGTGTFHTETEEFIPHLLTQEPSLDGKSATFNLDNSFEWHNGKPVTAYDLRAKYTLDKLNKDDKWDYIESVEVIDETTFEIQLKNEMNQSVWTNKILNTPLNVFDGGYWEGFLDDYEEDLPSYRKAQIRGEMRNLVLRDGEEDSVQAIGWGPFEMVEINPQHALLERYDGHPFSDGLNFEKIRFKTFYTKQGKFRALLDEELGAAHAVPTETIEQQISGEYSRYEYPRNIGVGWAFQYERPEINNIFQDRRVRRAFAYVLNKEDIINVSGLSNELSEAVRFDSGYFGDEATHKEYMGENILEKLSPSNYGPDNEKAARLLRDAGWSKEDGMWRDHTGEEVSITIKVPTTWIEWVNMAQSSASQLSDFGIDAEFKAEELVVYYGITMPQGKYDMAGWFTGGATDDPYAGYEWLQDGLPAVVQEHNMPDEYELPMPVGDPDGATQTLNPNEILDEIALTPAGPGETEPTQDLYAKLAWWYNQSVPVYMLNRNSGYAYVNSGDWAAPAQDSELANTFYPIWTFMTYGEFKARDGS